MVAASELNYNTTASATQMAQTIFGDSVDIKAASYSGSWYASAVYSGGDSTAPGVTPGDTGVILSTGPASWFTNSNGSANQSSSTSYNTGGPNNDSDFNAVAGTSTYDASFLEVDFVPEGDTMTMQFVFASDEYPEYSNSVYNDMVGVWVNGQHVPLSVTNTATSVGEVNQSDNQNLFTDNTDSAYNTEMDGFTVTMALTMPVNAGEVNSIKVGVADVTDSAYDSSLLIAGGSVQTDLVAQDDSITLQEGTTKTVDLLANDDNATGGSLAVTHINGVSVSAGDSVALATGQVVTLNTDGTIDLETGTDNDTVSFTYQAEATDGSGTVLETDTGFVTAETIPCFVAGTMIATPEGPKAIETLVVGDLVLTQDGAPQPIRWIGRRSVAAIGSMAPIAFRPGALGDHGALMLSPQHRVLLRDAYAELMFEAPEVLVKAKDLVNDGSIRRVEGGLVTYLHLLFDSHQIIWAEGLATESFLPGPHILSQAETGIARELTTLFPDLAVSAPGPGYGPAARPILNTREASVLLRQVA
ncbi:Hint domain-containing protein [Salibaculum halophilum]|uniref:Hint domain-containing protein n=1 Tax=Salibaculum halophilum TaxID=1914408 RepID=UPI000A100F70|nr:Hint domain-containing protein [Salibaculum halophilum]